MLIGSRGRKAIRHTTCTLHRFIFFGQIHIYNHGTDATMIF